MTANRFLETLYTEELYSISPRTTIVITLPWNDLKKEEKDQLTKISEALRQRINPRLGLEAFRIVYTPTLDLSQWSEKPKRLIYFGPPIKGLNFYEVIEAGFSKMVLSESLSQLVPDEASRSKLWIALKQLFAN